MSLTALISRLVHDVLTPGKFLFDIPVEVVYRKVNASGATTFNPETQEITIHEDVGTPVYAVFSNATERQIDGVNVKRNDRFFYISSANLVKVGITSVKPDDVIVQDGIVYRIMRADIDPTYSVWTILGRVP